MGLLFINALKGLKSKKVQMVGVIICIMLSTSIYTAMNLALDRMEDRYHHYLEEQNVEDFSFLPKIDYAKDYTKEEIQSLKENELKEIPPEQMKLVNQYQATIGIENIPNIDSLYQAISYIFNNYGANDKKLEEKIGETQAKYDFSYTKQVTKTTTEDKNLFKAMIYDKDMSIDIPYLTQGRMPENENEITLLPKFAKLNNISLNGTYQIGEKVYTVVGFAYSPEHIFPLISMNRPFFNEKTDNIMYMTQETFESFPGVKESSYVAAFNDKTKVFAFDTIIEMLKDDENIEFNPISTFKLIRVNTLEMEIRTDRLFAKYFLYLLLGISIFVIAVITKKRIDDERLQIGVLKSLGYKSFPIAISYLVYPIIGSIIGGVIGFLIGIPAHEILTNLYVSYFNLPITGFAVDIKYLWDSLFIPMIFLCVLAFLIAMFMLRKKPLQLLKEGSNLKVNLLNRFVLFVTKKCSFKTKFKLSLASRSLGKLFIVTLTSFCTGMLIVLILIGMNMFTSMINKTFEGLNYDNMVSYQSLQTDTSDTDDLVYSASISLTKVKDIDGNIHDVKIEKKKDDSNDKEEENKISVSVSGIDKETHYISILDETHNEIKNLLVSSSDIIINQNLAQLIQAKIGDTLIFENAEKEYEFKVVGIQDAYMGKQAYVSREYLSDILEGKLGFNTRYTNDDKYKNMSSIEESEANTITSIFSVSDLRENMEKQMQSSSASIYFVIAFASVLALIIILVIANIIVEENKKTISLMKVMGYHNRVISQIVLNIYTPFVIIAYLASIPAMKWILEYIVKQLTADMEMAIPISLSITKALVGLVGLLVAYYIAIFISRKSLNKVPLSIALKRE